MLGRAYGFIVEAIAFYLGIGGRLHIRGVGGDSPQAAAGLYAAAFNVGNKSVGPVFIGESNTAPRIGDPLHIVAVVIQRIGIGHGVIAGGVIHLPQQPAQISLFNNLGGVAPAAVGHHPPGPGFYRPIGRVMRRTPVGGNPGVAVNFRAVLRAQGAIIANYGQQTPAIQAVTVIVIKIDTAHRAVPGDGPRTAVNRG